MGDLGGFLSKPEVVRCTRQQRGGGAQDQNQGGHCHFPNERWVGVSTKKQALTHSVDTHTHTHNFPTEDFGAFYRKADSSLVDTKVGLSKRNSFPSKHYFLVSGDFKYEFSAPRLGLSSTYFVSLAFFVFGDICEEVILILLGFYLLLASSLKYFVIYSTGKTLVWGVSTMY